MRTKAPTALSAKQKGRPKMSRHRNSNNPLQVGYFPTSYARGLAKTLEQEYHYRIKIEDIQVTGATLLTVKPNPKQIVTKETISHIQAFAKGFKHGQAY